MNKTKRIYTNVHSDYVRKYNASVALVLCKIEDWCDSHKKKKNKQIDGNYWSGYLSIPAISEQTGLNERTVRRNLKFLIDNNIIQKGNFNQKSYDKTGWYRLLPVEEGVDKVDTTHRTEWTVGEDKLDSTLRTKLSLGVDKVDGTIPTHQPTHKNTHSYKSSTHLSGIEKILFDIENSETPTSKKSLLNWYQNIASNKPEKYKKNIELYNNAIELVTNHKELFQ
jgi:hypothetical protein